MTQDPRDIDPDDFFKDTRMSFGDHLEDLRVHLLRAVKGFVLACIIGFVIGRQVLAFIASPVEDQLTAFYRARAAKTREQLEAGGNSRIDAANKATPFVQVAFLREQLAALLDKNDDAVNQVQRPPDDIGDDKLFKIWMSSREPVREALGHLDASTVVGKRFALTTLSVQEAFVVYCKVSIVTGFVLGAPWIFLQIWSFIAVGLYPHEKRLVNVYMPFSLGLFFVGVVMCQFLVLPRAVEALLWFNEWIGLEPDLRLSEWLGFAIMMPVVFGLSFQTPLVMLFIYRIGIVDQETFRAKRKIIWFCLAIFSAIITPSTDPYSMLLLWVPLCLLFEVGIILCGFYPAPTFDDDFADMDEVIEV